MTADRGEFDHALLFTGHMIDAAGRAEARFPASAEGTARAAIRRAVEAVAGEAGGSVVGLAGGASGGDILFHEVCFELGIATQLYLALPIEEYLRESVAAAGADWVRRFDLLATRVGVRLLDASVVLRRRLQGGETLNVWARTNLWMVDEAIRLAQRQTLIALWDGKGGDGPGGTAHLVESAAVFGIEIAAVIDMQRLLESGG